MSTDTLPPRSRLSVEEAGFVLLAGAPATYSRLLEISKAYPQVPFEQLPGNIQREMREIIEIAHNLAGRTERHDSPAQAIPGSRKGREIAPRLKVWEWLGALAIGAVVTFLFFILAAPLGLGDASLFVFFIWPVLTVLTYAIAHHKRLAAAKRAQRIEEACKGALDKAHLDSAMRKPAERLCSDILLYERAFQKRGLTPQNIEEVLWWWLYYLLHDLEQQRLIPDLLTSGAGGGEAAFSLPLHRLIYDVAGAITGVLTVMRQKLSPDESRTFSRLGTKILRNWMMVSGMDPDSDDDDRKQYVYPQKLKDKSATELISLFLRETPFVDFFNTRLSVTIPVPSRFSHMHIVGGTGHGKTQLLQYFILHDLPHVAVGERSVIVIDSQGGDSQRGLINNILSLESVGAMADRVILIDPNEYTPALNLFDFGLDRLKGYADQQKRKQVINGAIELYAYMFGALLRAEVTMRQDVIFSNLARLMMVVPGATIKTLRDFMRQPELTRPYIPKLDDDSRDFFETEFFASKYNDTREQLLNRLWGVLTQTELASMFAAKRNKLDLFSAMNRGSLILISTNKRVLNQDASAIFGRFFIALIRQATRERELGDQYKLRDTFVYIDEAHEYFDESMGNLFEQARKFQVGMVIAHQHLGQFQKELRATVTGNTSVKIAGGVSHDDASDFAKEMNCERKFIQSMRKHEEDPKNRYTEFACYVKDKTDRAIALEVPLLKMERQPKMSPARRASLIEANRARYGATDEHPPDKPKDDDSPLGDPELL